MGVPQNELAALQAILLVEQQVVVELRRLTRVLWVLSGKPVRAEGFDESPTAPLAVPEVPILP